MKKYLLAAFAISTYMSLFAQASLDITVLDSTKKPIELQAIELENEAIGFSSQKITGSNGKVTFSGLSTSGSYTLRATSSQLYSGRVITDIKLISNQVKTITLVLEPAVKTFDAIVISGEKYNSINASNAEVASEMSAEEIQELPIEGRDISRSLYRLPNISQATGFFPEAPVVAINGANPLYTNYQIDGMENNENFLGGMRFNIPVGFTQNITALTNNFSAEHGLTSNGVINITSKSGTNETTGEVFYQTRPGAVIDASSPYAQRDLSGNPVKDGFQRHQAGFAVGGAIKENKTFYFVNYEHTTDLKDNLLNVPQLGINETVRGQNEFNFLSAKIDHYWSDKLRTSVRLNRGWIDIDRQGGGLDGGVQFPSAANTQVRNSLNLAFKNTYSKEDFTYEANYQFGRFNWNYADAVNPGSPGVTVLDPLEQTVAIIGHPGFTFNEEEFSHLLQQKFTLQRNKHTLKFGGQWRNSRFSLLGGGNTSGNYTVKLKENQLAQIRDANLGSSLNVSDIPANAEVLNYAVELGTSTFGRSQNIFSFYAEDQIAVTSLLNINMGLRYDYDDLSQGSSSQGDLNNLAPRLSANYQLNENTSLRAGYGIYYGKILYAIYSDALQFNTNAEDYQQQLRLLQNQGIIPNDADIEAMTHSGNYAATVADVEYLQGPSAAELESQRESAFINELRVINPNGYQNPFSHQYMLGLQHKANERSLFYVDFMHNRSHNLFRLRNLNAPAPYPISAENVQVRSISAADSSRPVPIYTENGDVYSIGPNGDTLRGIARNVMMTETEGRSNYYAMNFTYQKDRGLDNWSLRIMYTLSFLENNTEDINFRAMDANDFEAEWGPSINDRRHLINGIFSYYPYERLNLTLAMLLQSGQPINRVPDAREYGTTDLNGDGRSFGDAYVGNSDRSPGESRNSDRLPWSNTFDFSAFYNIPIGESTIELSAMVFNLFNAENLSGYANNAVQSNQIQPGPAASGLLIRRNAAPPRQFQFALRYVF